MKQLVLAIVLSATAHAGDLLRKDAQVDVAGEPVYDIDQAIDDTSGAVSARLTLRYTNTTGAALAALPLLLHPNAARELGEKDTGSITITGVTAGGAPAHWTVKRPTLVEVATAVPPGASATLVVTYKAQLRDLGPQANDALAQMMSSMGSLASSGTSDYGLLARGDGIVTLASAYPMVAPWRDGAFDTSPPSKIGDIAYNHPATFHVRTVLPAGVTMVSNLVDRASGKGVIVSDGAAVRDFVMVAGRDLARVEKQVGATRVASVFRANDARGGKLALDAAVSALRTFEARFGAYPYAELDVVESSIVGGAGGVEFCGLVLVAGSLYRDPAASSSPIAMMLKMMNGLGAQLGGGKPAKLSLAGVMDPVLEFTVAHEVAHQWFAELVGNDSRRYPMVDEPLAQYAAGVAIADRHGAAAAKTAMDNSVKMNYALYRLLGGVDAPVLRDTASYHTQIEYAGLIYGKAPYVYVALRNKLGEAALDRAIRSAVAERRFQLSSIDDWIAALERGGATNARATFAHWFGGANGDADLGVDDSGDFVIATMLPPDVAQSIHESLAMIGLTPKDLFGMLMGGRIGTAPTGAGIDVDAALNGLLGD